MNPGIATASTTVPLPDDIFPYKLVIVDSSCLAASARLLNNIDKAVSNENVTVYFYDENSKLLSSESATSDSRGYVNAVTVNRSIKRIEFNFDKTVHASADLHCETRAILEIIDNPVTVVATTIAAVTISTATAVISGIAGMAAAQMGLKDFFLVLLNYFFSIFAFKRKSKFGIVFDASTDKPVSQAIVQLYEAKSLKLVATALSNKKGQYIFSAKEGEYTMSVIKAGYLFPSKLIKGNSRFYNSYLGQNFTVSSKSPAINYLIPLDPNEKAIFRPGIFYRVADSISFRYAMLMFGSGVAIFSLIHSPWPWGYISATSFLILWVSEFIIQNRMIKYSKVVDDLDRKPLSLALVRVVGDDGKLVETYVSDQHGRVLPNVSSLGQKILVEKSGYDKKEFQASDTGLIERKRFNMDRVTG